MNEENDTSAIILVVEDVHETRDGIEKLLTTDGYRVSLARDEQDAIKSAQRTRPDLILVSLAGSPAEVIRSARNIREHSEVGDQIPVVVFCIEELGEGDEVAIGHNVHVTRPDNFNQLRSLLARLLHKISLPLRQKYEGRDDWELQSSGVKSTGISGGDLMTIHKAFDIASLLRREEYVAQNMGVRNVRSFPSSRSES